MKKVFLFAGLCVSAVIGFEYFAYTVVNVAAGLSLGSQVDAAGFVRLGLSIALLLAAILGIVFMAKLLRKKDVGSDLMIPAILLLVCAGIVMLGFLPVQIFESSQSISYYSEPTYYMDERDSEAKVFITLSVSYILIVLVEGLSITTFAVLSLVKGEEKKSE